MLLAASVAVVLTVAAPAKGNSGNHKDFAGLVEIGGDRKMYMECRGKGSQGAGTAPKHGARPSTHPSRRCCLQLPKPTGFASTIVQGLFS